MDDNSGPILETLEAVLEELKALREELGNRPAAPYCYHYHAYPLPGAAPYYYPTYCNVGLQV